MWVLFGPVEEYSRCMILNVFKLRYPVINVYQYKYKTIFIIGSISMTFDKL